MWSVNYGHTPSWKYEHQKIIPAVFFSFHSDEVNLIPDLTLNSRVYFRFLTLVVYFSPYKLKGVDISSYSVSILFLEYLFFTFWGETYSNMYTIFSVQFNGFRRMYLCNQHVNLIMQVFISPGSPLVSQDRQTWFWFLS